MVSIRICRFADLEASWVKCVAPVPRGQVETGERVQAPIPRGQGETEERDQALQMGRWKFLK